MGEEQPQGARGAVPDPLCVNASLHQKRFGDSAPAARTEGARVGRQEPPGRGQTGSPIALGPSLSLSRSRSRREAVALEIRKAAVLCHIRAKV